MLVCPYAGVPLSWCAPVLTHRVCYANPTEPSSPYVVIVCMLEDPVQNACKHGVHVVLLCPGSSANVPQLGGGI